MSPKNKKKLNILRNKLDKIDNRLIDIIKIRTNLVTEVVKLKDYKNQIINKKKLHNLRKKLDKLDDKLIDIIKVRTLLVNEVVKLKEFKNEIVDKKRISIILKKIKRKSISKKIDPKITNRIWKNMIWSYINYERKIFKKK